MYKNLVPDFITDIIPPHDREIANYFLQNRENVSNMYTIYKLILGIFFAFLSILHARIRNNCSDLKLDLFHNHLSADSSSSCWNDNEDALHYLFEY